MKSTLREVLRMWINDLPKIGFASHEIHVMYISIYAVSNATYLGQ